MADTIRTRAALQALLANNVGGDISAQDIRDFLASCVLRSAEGTVTIEGAIRAHLYLVGDHASQTNVGNVWFMSPESGKTDNDTVASIVGRTTTTDNDRGGDIEFWTKEDASGETGIVNRMTIDHTGGLFLFALKSGINQGAAGAAANELWHDTTDHTIKIGV